MQPRKPRRKASRDATAAPGTTVVVMCLYIANSAPNSVQAVTNLDAICKAHLHDNYRLEIIDVLQFPLRALADGILVTPSLAKLSPGPAVKVVGNLSDTGSVLRALGITCSSPVKTLSSAPSPAPMRSAAP